jgi:hypothetical protein
MFEPQGKPQGSFNEFAAALSSLSPAHVNAIYSAVLAEMNIVGSHLGPFEVPTLSEKIGFLANVLSNPKTDKNTVEAFNHAFLQGPARSWGTLGREMEEYFDLMAPQNAQPSQTEEEEEVDGPTALSFSSAQTTAAFSVSASTNNGGLSFRGDTFGGINAQHSALNTLTVALSETGAFSVNSNGTITNVFGAVVGNTAIPGIGGPTSNPAGPVSEPSEPGPGVGSPQGP